MLNYSQSFSINVPAYIHSLQRCNLSKSYHQIFTMKFILVVVLLCILQNGGVQGRITNLAQLQAIQALSTSPYPWGEWVKFRAAMNGVDLSPGPPPTEEDDAPEVATGDEDDDADDLDDAEEDPEVIEFLKRAAAFGEEAGEAGGKKSKKTKAAKAKKAPKLKPWEAAIAAKKAAASTTTTPATTTDFSISYSELVKAILAAHDEETGRVPATPATTTELPFDPENVNYEELAKAILGVEKQRQEAAASTTPAP